MKPLPAMTPESFQILIIRELRKVGFDVGTVRIHRRSELPEPERGFVLELAVSLARPGTGWRALVACRHQAGTVERNVIDSVKARLPEVPADVSLVFATADFGTDALVAAREAGVALLRVVDGRTVYDTSGWSDPGGGTTPPGCRRTSRKSSIATSPESRGSGCSKRDGRT